MASVVVVPWARDWPAYFATVRDGLLPLFALGEAVIEHIGSTSVPGLAAKPVIDVMLGAPSLAIIETRIG